MSVKQKSSLIRPVHYDLYLRPDLDKLTFFGYEDIVLEIEEPITEVVLNSVGLEIVRRTYIIQNGTIHNCSSIAYDEEAQTVNIKFVEGLSAGEATLHIEFDGVLGDNLSGFYRARYTLPDGTERYMATTQFEAADARSAFPCFDEPAMKATFRVMITAPEDRTVLSNMPVHIEVKTGDGQKIVVFEKTPKMSTYFLAFIVGDLESVEAKTKKGTPVRLFAIPGNEERCAFALEVCTRTLEELEEYFGVPFPLPKMDMVAVPDFASGAMENWGLVTYREAAILIDRDSSPASAKQRAASIISHENAHQWFGNLVTMNWWNDLWLNEGFASWMGDKIIDRLFPDWDTWELFYIDDTASGLALDGLRSTHPIEVEVRDPKEIGQVFDAISYSKGASVIRMLEEHLGEDVFRKGLALYITTHMYGNARTEDLWAALEKISGEPVAEMMDTWTKREGYPVLHVSQTHKGKTRSLELLQERFFYGQSTSKEKRQTQWKIPLGVTTESGARPARRLRLMEERTGTIRINNMPRNEWVKLNKGQTGFFRVDYSPDMLAALYPAVESLTLPTLDRLGLVADSYALSRAGVIPATRFLEIAQRCQNETEYAVWNELAAGLSGITRLLRGEPYYEDLREYVRSIFLPVFSRIGWDSKKKDRMSDTFLRSLVIGQLGAWEDEDVTLESNRRFKEFLADPSSLNPDLRNAVWGIAALSGDEATYEELLGLYQKEELQSEQARYLVTFGRFKDKTLLKRALAFAFSSDVRSQDAGNIISSIALNHVGRELAWEFLKTNWAEIEKRYGEGISFMISGLISSVVSGMTTPEMKQDVEEFFSKHPVPAADMALRQSLEQVDINIAWLEKNREVVGQWLEEKSTSG